MRNVDITPTPTACREIARVFEAQRAHAEAMIERAARALDTLDGLADDEIGPWDRALLAAAFDALGDGERVRVARLQEGLDALESYAATDEDIPEGRDHAAHA